MAAHGKLETRDYKVKLETRAAETGEGIVAGRPIVYEEKTNIGDMFYEVIERGALDETDLSDVRLCLNHDTSYVYARAKRDNPKSTMRFLTDANGAVIEASLNIKGSPKAQDFYSAAQRGDMDKMSFMFFVEEDRWTELDSDMPTRHITKIGSVAEVSMVTFAAYNDTSITARNAESLENAKRSLENAKKRAGSAETGQVDELELEKAKTEIFKNI